MPNSEKSSQGKEKELQYRYVSKPEVSKALDGFGYGPSKKFVDALYVREDGNVGVGVLIITEEHCHDHFGVFPGVIQGEAAGQTLLLLHHFTEGIIEGQRPLLQHIAVDPVNPAFPATTLNIIVEKGRSEGNEFLGNGRIMSGDVEISRVDVSGTTVRKEILEKLIQRSKRRQERSPVKFPLRD